MSEKPLSRYATVLGITALAGGVAGFASAMVGLFTPEGGWLGVVLIACAVTLAMGIGLWVSLRWFQALDEAAQEAHKWAWWWGATVGLAVAGVIILTILYGLGDLDEAPLESGMLLGVCIVVGCQLLGYGVAWAVWWLKRR